MIRISWVFEGIGGGTRVVVDVDGAARALADAVRVEYADHGTATLAHILTTVVAPLRQLLVTEGHMALERDSEWSAGLAGISVRLSRSK